MLSPEVEDKLILRNVCNYSSIQTGPHSRRLQHSAMPLC